jgi:hypothetical protein
MNAWDDNGEGFLVRNDEGLFNYWWAGCFQSDEWVTIDELFTPDARQAMRSLSLTAVTHYSSHSLQQSLTTAVTHKCSHSQMQVG